MTEPRLSDEESVTDFQSPIAGEVAQPADVASGGLVFGELEEELPSEPTSISRSSSGAAESAAVQTADENCPPPCASNGTVEGAEPIAATQQQAVEHVDSAAEDESLNDVRKAQLSEVDLVEEQSASAESAEIASAAEAQAEDNAATEAQADDSAAADSVNAKLAPLQNENPTATGQYATGMAPEPSQQAPHLETVASASLRQKQHRQLSSSSLPEPHFWREGSGLVTLAPPGQHKSPDVTGSEDDISDSESSIVASRSATAEAAGDMPSLLSPFMEDPAAQTSAASAHNQHHDQLHQLPSPKSPLSVASLGSLRSPRAAGIERTASWQLQHAAAAAAGTATHPAPPRSDLHLTRLSSSSPSSPHGEDGWAAWQRRRRHFFVLTAAGKPVYSLHGDEQALAGFMAVIQALVSVVADQGDSIQQITVGPTQLMFFLRSQLYFVVVSSRGEAAAALRRQLELLYQTIVMFVTAGIERTLHRTPGYDVHHLLTGSKATLTALTSSFGDCLGWMFGSVEPAAAAPADRMAAAAALQEAVKSADALYGILLVGGRILGVEVGRGPPPLNVYDLLLLANFVNSSESLRYNETFVPVCLPNFQPSAFLHAYIAQLHPPQQQQQQQSPEQPDQQQRQQTRRHQPHAGDSNSIFFIMLSGSADSFHKLSAAKQALANALQQGSSGGVLQRVRAAAGRGANSKLRAEQLPAPLGGGLGSTPLWHAVIYYPQRHQHIMLGYPEELFPQRSQRKQLVRSYCRLFCAAHGAVLEAEAQGIRSSGTWLGPAISSNTGGPSSSSGGGGSSGGTSSVMNAAGSIASIVGAGSASVGSGAAAVAAAAAAYVLPHGGGHPRSNKLVWVTSQRWVTGVVPDRDVEVYATFDPLTDKELGLKYVEQLKKFFGDKLKQQELLVPGF